MDSRHEVSGAGYRELARYEGAGGAPPMRRVLPADLSFCEVHTDEGDILVLGFRHSADGGGASALSASERIVVGLALDGKSNVEIGKARATSARTVANQLASAFRKLGVSSRRELATVAPLANRWPHRSEPP